MKTTRAKKAPSKKTDRRRKPRRRGVPRWLSGRTDLDEVAQRRTLLILSVLSGHTPVTTAIAEHGISRPLYYQLETKALVGMMRALIPGASASSNPDDATPTRQLAEDRALAACRMRSDENRKNSCKLDLVRCDERD